MKTKILITGSTGFIGKHLIEELSKNKYDFICLTRSPVNYQHIIGSLEDKELLNKITKDIDVVIHLASVTKNQNKELNYKINVEATKNLVEACEKNKVKKIIYTGTINSTFKVRAHYGETKKLAQEIITNSNLNHIILRLNMVYGPGDNNLSKTIKLIKKLPITPIIGSGKSLMQPVYVKDVVNAMMEAIKTKEKRKTYNIGGPESFTFNEYINTIKKELNIKKLNIHIPIYILKPIISILEKFISIPINKKILYSIIQDKNTDISLSEKELNFKPKSFKEIISSLY